MQEETSAVATTVEHQDDEIFVPPSQGADPLLQTAKKHQLVAGLHVATGDFEKALGLLKKQLAVANFEPLKQLFVDAYTMTRLKLQTLPHTTALGYQLRAGDLPAVALTTQSLVAKYSKGIDLTTRGEFNLALEAFRACLQSVPISIVHSQTE